MKTPANQSSDEEPSDPEIISVPAMVAKLLLTLLLGLVGLLVASVLVVYVTGLAARRFGLPELAVNVTFLGLLAMTVLMFAATSIATALAQTSNRLGMALDDAGDKIAVEVSDATGELVERLGEIPAVVVEPPREVLSGAKPPRSRRR